MGKLEDLQDAIIESKIKHFDSIEKEIEHYNRLLKEKSIVRKEINTYKYKKDELITQYIEETTQPNKLKQHLINYKALFFYFKKKFIESNHILDIDLYDHSGNFLSDEFKDNFNIDNRIILKTLYTNFPHLIGFKNKDDESILNQNAKLNDDFLNKIFYETNLLEDYETHGCDLDKIQSISWIEKTLRKPNYVFTMDALKNSKLEATLIFVRISRGTVHYTSLVNIKDNKFAINSHHSLGIAKYKKMFDEEQAIYKRA